MHAFVLTKYGQPLELQEVPEPEVGAHDVLVQVEATALNQLDEKIRAGEFTQILPLRLPVVLGHDVAGTVIRVGSGVRSLKPGDQVFSRPRDHRIGTFAERIAIDESDVALAPTSVSTAEAASLPLVALTAWQALVERGGVQPGQKVLIHAGSGGVGLIAVQLAKHLGAHVTTTASAKNADLLRSLGADEVIDHRTQRFDQVLADQDLVLDSLGAENVTRSISVVRPGGKVIGISGPPDPAFARRAGLNPVVRFAIGLLSRKVRRLAQQRGVSYEFLWMHASGEQLRQVADLVDRGVVRPVVGATHAFAETPAALAALATSRAPGKTVITLP